MFGCRKQILDGFLLYCMNKLYMFPTFLTSYLKAKTLDKKSVVFNIRLVDFMKKNYSILILLIYVCFSSNLNAQTLLVDNFTRTNSTTVGNSWTEIETVAGGAQIVSNRLQLGSTTAGIEFVYKDLSGFTGPITTDGITNNTATLTWAFNFRQTRTDPSGFDASNYGVAFVLCKSTTPTSTGNGYAVLIGQSGTTDAIRLARFTGGINANADFTNIISGNDYGAEYLSVRVTYNPTTDEWALFTESNASAFPQSDPRSTSTQIGSNTANTTYTATGNDLRYFGPMWNHATGASDNAIFDDVYAPIVPVIALADNGTQIGAASVTDGTTNHILHQFQLTVTNTNATLTGVACTTAGNYDAADIDNLKVRYSTDATLDVGDATLSSTYTPTGTAGAKSFTSFTSQGISSGSTGYVFITADINSAASGGSGTQINLSAITTGNLTFSAGTKSGSTADGGTQTFTASSAPTVTIDNTGAPATGNIVYNTNDVRISGFRLLPTSSVDFTAVNIATSGTATTSDISNFRLIHDADSSGTYNGGDAVVATVASLANPLAFSGFTETLTARRYYLIIANTAAGATDGRTITASISASSNVTSTGNESGTATGNEQTIQAPEIRVEGNSTEIVDGDVTPIVGDHTAFGSVEVNVTPSPTRTFTIKNIGNQTLDLNPTNPRVAISGSSQFTVSTQPSAATISGPSGSLTFVVTYAPTTYDLQTATISIANNDANGSENPYTFDVNGTGIYSNESIVADNTNYASGSPESNINIVYINFRDGIPARMIPMKIKIQDGGADEIDNDNVNTVLTGIKFTVKDHLAANQLAQIRTAVLTTTGGTTIATATKVGSELVFTGMSGTNVTAVDGGATGNANKILHLRVSFDSSQVIDNTKLIFQVSNVTAGSGSSTFPATDGGAAQSDNDNGLDRNRIEVTATKLNISTIADGFVATNLTAFTITAADAYNRTDRDRTENVALTTSGTGITSTSPYALVAGVVSISDVQYASVQTLINITGTVVSPSLTGTSNNFYINVITAVAGDYRTNPGVLPGDYVAFGSAAVGSISGVRVWQTWNGSSWVDATTPPQSIATVPPNIYINRGNFVDAAGGRLYNNIYVDFADDSYIFGSYSSTPGLSIATGKVLEIKKGIFQLGGILDMQGSSSLIIRKNSTMEIQNTVTSTEFTRNASSTWEVEDTAFVFIDSYVPNAWTGTEIFHDESYFEITDWNETTDENLFATGAVSANSYNGFSALFGNLSLTFTTLSSNWDDVFPDGTYNLTHGDFEVTNNDGSGGDNINLIFSGTVNVTIGGNMIIAGSEDVQFQVGAGTSTLTVKDDFIKNGSGAFALHQYTSGSNTLSIDSNLTVNTGIFYVTSTSAGAAKAIINLKGNLKLASGAYLTNSNGSGYTNGNDSIYFNGTDTQTINVIPHASNDLMNIRFVVKGGAYVRQINQDVLLGGNSGITVQNLGTYDFGFNGTTSTGLLTSIAGSNTGTFFKSQQGSTLRITHLQGISTTGALGNVQVTASNRTFDQVATFWYIGRDNQVTGNGLGTGSTAKVVICELLDNTKSLSLTNSTAVSESFTIDATYGGHLYIKKGQLRETVSENFTFSAGTLRMEPGTLYYIPRGQSQASDAISDVIPRMAGGTANQYYLTGGTIEFAGTGSSHAYQTLRGSRTYHNLKFSGANTYVYPATLAYTYKNLSNNATVNDSLEVTNGSIVDCISTTTNANSFTGPGALIMSGATSRFRIRQPGSTAQPSLTGDNCAYSLANGTVEFYGTTSTEQQQLRGNYTTCTSCTKPKINYYNIDINAAAANLQTFTTIPNATPQLAGVGNVDLNSSFLLTKTLNVNSPAVLRMDQTEFIDDGTGTVQAVNINSGAGLIYANANGIKTSGIGVNDGNIRTSGTRIFSTTANYGFCSSDDMVSGNGLPATVAGLYCYKNFGVNKVTLNNGGTTVTGVLGLQRGKIVSSSAQKVTLAVVSTSDIKSPANAGGVQDMGYDSSYVEGLMDHNSASTGELIFPIGSSAKYGPIALTPFNGTTQTYSADYSSAGYGNYTLDPINNTPQIDHVSKVEFWNVVSSELTSPNHDARIKLFWRAHSRVGTSGVQWDNLLVVHNDGTDWNTEDNNASGTYVSGTSINWGSVISPNYAADFSPFTIGTRTSDNPLPVELTSFTGTCLDDNLMEIKWSTASELNSKQFIVQRSVDGAIYTNVATIPAAGNSNQPKNYSITDAAVNSNSNYYRLIEVDTDDKQTIYSFIFVRCSEVNGVHIFYTQPKIVVEINSNTNKQIGFNVYEVSGKLLAQENKQIVRGYNRFDLNFKNKLADGIYIIQMIDGDKVSATKVMVH